MQGMPEPSEVQGELRQFFDSCVNKYIHYRIYERTYWCKRRITQSATTLRHEKVDAATLRAPLVDRRSYSYAQPRPHQEVVDTLGIWTQIHSSHMSHQGSGHGRSVGAGVIVGCGIGLSVGASDRANENGTSPIARPPTDDPCEKMSSRG